MTNAPHQTVLLADGDIIVRHLVAEYLRACGHKVLEAASCEEAKAILQAGIEINSVLSDAELAGGESGFALAHWIRRYRPKIEVVLSTTVIAKAQVASEFCARFPTQPPCDSAGLAARIRALSVAHRRRARPSASPVTARKRRRLS